MDRRLALQALLEELLGTENVYFQPPDGKQMGYPAIVYTLDDILTQHADNSPYRQTKRYQVTVIDRDPDSAHVDAVAALPLCSFDRHFQANSLNHTNFNLYF